MPRACVTALVLLGGCGRIGFGGGAAAVDAIDGTPADGDILTDGMPDATVLGPWGPVTVTVTGIGGTPLDDPTLSADRLVLIANYNFNDIGIAKRLTTAQAFGPMGVDAQLSTGMETEPHMAADGLTIYFASARGTGNAGFEIYVSTRTVIGNDWSAPTRVAPLCSNVDDLPGTPTADGLLIPVTVGVNPREIYLSSRASTAAPWGTPVRIAEVNSPQDEAGAHLSADGLALYFYSTRNGIEDLFVATRASRAVPFSTPQPITELNTAFEDTDPWVSPDQRHIVFGSDRSGGAASLYEASR